jgi:ribonuclease P protein component
MGSWPVRLVRRILYVGSLSRGLDAYFPMSGEQDSGNGATARPERTTGAVTTAIRRDERFGRDRRLRSSRDFAHVRQAGRSVSGALLTVGFLRRTALASPGPAQPVATARVGFTVGKRVGGAVIRNRVRRRLREVARRRISALAPDWDLVIVARPAAAGATSEALARDLDALLARAKVLKTGSEEPTI